MFLSEWREFPSAPCLAKKRKNLMTARVSMLLKSRASLTSFRACFLPGRAKDLSAPRVLKKEDGEVFFGLTGLGNTEVADSSKMSVNWCWQPTVNMEGPVPSGTSADS